MRLDSSPAGEGLMLVAAPAPRGFGALRLRRTELDSYAHRDSPVCQREGKGALGEVLLLLTPGCPLLQTKGERGVHAASAGKS